MQKDTNVSRFSTMARLHARSSSSTTPDFDSVYVPSDSKQRSPPRRSTPNFDEVIDARTRVDDLLDGLVSTPSSRNRQNSASAVSDQYEASKLAGIRTRESRQPGDFVSQMHFPDAPGGPTSQSAEVGPQTIQALNELRMLNPRNKRTIRSRPTVGRTIELDPGRGMDFGRAMRQLNILCATNKVRADLMRQKYHERPGMKRKRLKSERWRKLFRDGFRATVGRVKEMRRKGW
ncbi:MAG: hypothetical protein Q9164_002867 [Protoblastenia rupestris]